MAEIYEIGTVRARQIKLAKLKEMLGELVYRVAFPPPGIVEEELVYILPASSMRRIDDLSLGELDDLLNGHMKFFILK